MLDATVSIGDMGFRLRSDDGERLFQLAPVYHAFTSQVRPEIELSIRYCPLPEAELGRLVFESEGTWSLHSHGSELTYHFRVREDDGSDRLYNTITLSCDLTSGTIHALAPLRDNPSVYRPFDYPMSEVLAVHLLSRGRGAELHAVGIDDNGRGDLFCGVSGAGKSTTSYLWQGELGVQILSDDRIIARKHGDRFWIYGTPWHGEAQFASPHSIPLSRLFMLRHGTENHVRDLSRSEAVARLMTCCFATFWDRDGMAFTISFLEELAKSVPCYELSFVPDHSVVDFVRSL